MSEALQQEIRHLRTLEGSARDPRDRIFLPLADAHLRLGDLDRARELLEDGLTRHPDFVGGHVLMARLLEEAGDDLQAEERWATARRLDPKNADVLLALGRILIGRGESLGGQLVLQARAMDPTAGGQEPDADLVMISDLAPGLPDDTPVVSIADLAPDAEAKVVPISDLAPTDVDEPAVGEPDVVQPESVAVGTAAQDAAEPDVVESDADAAVADMDVAESDVDVVVTEVADGNVAHAEADHVEVDPTEVAADAGRDGRVVTRTLAELFAAQGQQKRAVEMYEELVSRKPHDEALRARLAELRSDEWEAEPSRDAASETTGETTGATDPLSADGSADVHAEVSGVADAGNETLEVPAEADVADEEEFDPRLSPAAPEPEMSTPFAWTASGEGEDEAPEDDEADDESPEDEPISDYLGGLLGYSPNRSSDDPSRS